MPTTTVSVTAMLPVLHASSTADLAFWTNSELVAFLDEGLKRLAQVSNVFVRRDTTISTVLGTRIYALPVRTLNIIHVAYNNVPLRASSTHELAGKDDYYLQTQTTPTHWYSDRETLNNIALYPVPDAVGSVAIIASEVLADLSDGDNMAVPVVFADYLEVRTLSEAYGREGDAQMPEVSGHLLELGKLYEQLAAEYWGE